MSPSFLEIPDVPMEMIMNYLDYTAIQCVRKTCWDLRNFIDDKKPGIGIEQIRIYEMDFAEVRLVISEPITGQFINLDYKIGGANRCKIKGGTSNGWKNKNVQNLNFLDAVFHDIKVALNSQKSVIKKVSVTGETIFEKIEERMKSQKPFATESIEIRGSCLEHARQIMRCADPKYLKFIEYSDAPTKICETVKLESSKNIQNFSHFSMTSIQLENLDVETLRAIKENFLQFHEYDKDLFVHNPIRENLFIDAFGEALETLEENEENRFFNVSGNNEKVLKVHNQYLGYKFQFVEKCEVPGGYEILD
ncbi:hypothetical protein GCK72_021375 [Caenorhabditis remanei]|uniref:F-box domain-containing protein n=1 Tax=Caenorhabditis remanei TaxID=31234 RepID=A0A6A5GJN6_CAERE|nr:hypothetical protein GCK72_021375 [Caenorhabditis remanei]KAF1754811.1 hypothetical protein GCK72_021375 [Caenorhabditis remanei]